MRADRTIGILDRDRAFQNGSKRLPDVKVLRLAADEDRDWLKIACHRLRRLCRKDPRVLRRQGGRTSRRERIELRRQLSSRNGQLRFNLSEPCCCAGLGIFELGSWFVDTA